MKNNNKNQFKIEWNIRTHYTSLTRLSNWNHLDPKDNMLRLNEMDHMFQNYLEYLERVDHLDQL